MKCKHCGKPLVAWDYYNDETGRKVPMNPPRYLHQAFIPYRECVLDTSAEPEEERMFWCLAHDSEGSTDPHPLHDSPRCNLWWSSDTYTLEDCEMVWT